MRVHSWALAALAALAVPSQGALAQNEAALRAAFEGKSLTVKVDMPATSKGVDVFPQESMPVNWREMANRMKEFGTALKPGQQVMITKVVVKKDSHIEFQLGGGGWGTFGDRVNSSSSVSATTESETKEERDLKARIKAAQGPTERKRLEKELANARSERERENSKARAEAAQANEAREANMRVKRAESGSRFNIRYRNGIPPFALTPQGVAEALAPYADIAGMPVAAAGRGTGGRRSRGGELPRACHPGCRGDPGRERPGRPRPQEGADADRGRGAARPRRIGQRGQGRVHDGDEARLYRRRKADQHLVRGWGPHRLRHHAALGPAAGVRAGGRVGVSAQLCPREQTSATAERAGKPLVCTDAGWPSQGGPPGWHHQPYRTCRNFP
ncbi:MAG: hypothetical protein IPG88_08790 [Gemmatimonadetes bacterium]|nr:hypothetical protein [Gemmatimonadota bacterium]